MSNLLDPRDDPYYANKTRAWLYTQLVAANELCENLTKENREQYQLCATVEHELDKAEDINNALKNKLHNIQKAIETAIAMRHPEVNLPRTVGGYTPAENEIKFALIDEERNLLLHLYNMAGAPAGDTRAAEPKHWAHQPV